MGNGFMNDVIIDIHSHVVYGIDDGAADYEQSLRLIKMEYEQGVRGIFCTSHSYGMVGHYEEYQQNFVKMKNAAQARYPDLSLYEGCEVLCAKHDMAETMQRIKNGIIPTMNGTKYVLAEFDPHATVGMEEMRCCLEYILDYGYIPIIAHAERYRAIYDDPIHDVMWMKERGCLVQINLFSMEQDTGWRKELANAFLNHQLVDLIGTDTHNLYYKSPEVSAGAMALQKYGTEYAHKVLYGNAMELIRSKEETIT